MQSIATISPQRFDMKRFGAYFRLYVFTYRRKLLLFTSAMLIISLVLMMLTYYMGGSEYYDMMAKMRMPKGYDPMWPTNMQFFIILAVFFSATAGSYMYKLPSSKNTRLGTLTLPASQFEKFLTWWLIYLPLALAAMFVSFYLADVIRVVWLKLFTANGNYAVIISPGAMLTFTVEEGAKGNGSSVPTAYGILVALNAFFAIGSIFFTRQSFLKTMGVGFLLLIFFGIIFSLGVKTFYTPGTRFNGPLFSSTALYWVITGLICIYLYWLSYARYKELEIVDRW